MSHPHPQLDNNLSESFTDSLAYKILAGESVDPSERLVREKSLGVSVGVVSRAGSSVQDNIASTNSGRDQVAAPTLSEASVVTVVRDSSVNDTKKEKVIHSNKDKKDKKKRKKGKDKDNKHIDDDVKSNGSSQQDESFTPNINNSNGSKVSVIKLEKDKHEPKTKKKEKKTKLNNLTKVSEVGINNADTVEDDNIRLPYTDGITFNNIPEHNLRLRKKFGQSSLPSELTSANLEKIVPVPGVKGVAKSSPYVMSRDHLIHESINKSQAGTYKINKSESFRSMHSNDSVGSAKLRSTMERLISKKWDIPVPNDNDEILDEQQVRNSEEKVVIKLGNDSIDDNNLTVNDSVDDVVVEPRNSTPTISPSSVDGGQNLGDGLLLGYDGTIAGDELEKDIESMRSIQSIQSFGSQKYDEKQDPSVLRSEAGQMDPSLADFLSTLDRRPSPVYAISSSKVTDDGTIAGDETAEKDIILVKQPTASFTSMTPPIKTIKAVRSIQSFGSQNDYVQQDASVLRSEAGQMDPSLADFMSTLDRRPSPVYAISSSKVTDDGTIAGDETAEKDIILVKQPTASFTSMTPPIESLRSFGGQKDDDDDVQQDASVLRSEAGQMDSSLADFMSTLDRRPSPVYAISSSKVTGDGTIAGDEIEKDIILVKQPTASFTSMTPPTESLRSFGGQKVYVQQNPSVLRSEAGNVDSSLADFMSTLDRRPSPVYAISSSKVTGDGTIAGDEIEKGIVLVEQPTPSFTSMTPPIESLRSFGGQKDDDDDDVQQNPSVLRSEAGNVDSSLADFMSTLGRCSSPNHDDLKANKARSRDIEKKATLIKQDSFSSVALYKPLRQLSLGEKKINVQKHDLRNYVDSLEMKEKQKYERKVDDLHKESQTHLDSYRKRLAVSSDVCKPAPNNEESSITSSGPHKVTSKYYSRSAKQTSLYEDRLVKLIDLRDNVSHKIRYLESQGASYDEKKHLINVLDGLNSAIDLCKNTSDTSKEKCEAYDDTSEKDSASDIKEVADTDNNESSGDEEAIRNYYLKKEADEKRDEVKRKLKYIEEKETAKYTGMLRYLEGKERLLDQSRLVSRKQREESYLSNNHKYPPLNQTYHQVAGNSYPNNYFDEYQCRDSNHFSNRFHSSSQNYHVSPRNGRYGDVTGPVASSHYDIQNYNLVTTTPLHIQSSVQSSPLFPRSPSSTPSASPTYRPTHRMIVPSSLSSQQPGVYYNPAPPSHHRYNSNV